MDPNSPFAVPQGPMTVDVPGIQMPAPAKRGGMFGKAGKFLQDFLINYSANQGNPGSLSFLQQRQAQREAEQRRQQEEQQYARKRTDGWEDWVQREMWERANPMPSQGSEFERMAEAAGYKPGTPEHAELMKRMVGIKQNPIVMTPYGPMPYSAVAGQQGNLPQTLSDDDFGPQGGQTPPASGGFPRPF